MPGPQIPMLSRQAVLALLLLLVLWVLANLNGNTHHRVVGSEMVTDDVVEVAER
jgi:hypothetical protein